MAKYKYDTVYVRIGNNADCFVEAKFKALGDVRASFKISPALAKQLIDIADEAIDKKMAEIKLELN